MTIYCAPSTFQHNKIASTAAECKTLARPIQLACNETFARGKIRYRTVTPMLGEWGWGKVREGARGGKSRLWI